MSSSTQHQDQCGTKARAKWRKRLDDRRVPSIGPSVRYGSKLLHYAFAHLPGNRQTPHSLKIPDRGRGWPVDNTGRLELAIAVFAERLLQRFHLRRRQIGAGSRMIGGGRLRLTCWRSGGLRFLVYRNNGGI